MNIVYIAYGFLATAVSLWMLTVWNSKRSIQWRKEHLGKTVNFLMSLSIFLLLLTGLYYLWIGFGG